MLTPEKLYDHFTIDNSIDHKNAALSMFSPASFLTPNTQKYISDLSQLPLSSEKLNSTSLDTFSLSKLQSKNEELEKRCKHLSKLLSKKRATISFLKMKCKLVKKKTKTNVDEFIQSVNFPSLSSKNLVTMQINHKLRTPWTSGEKKLSLSLYYKSPSTYKFMRRNKIIIPGESTVRRWLNSISYSTGFSPTYMEQIQLKVSTMHFQERKCTILLDEVSIMKAIEYNKTMDIIEGYEDLGNLGRTDKIGSHALVIMIRGLYVNWKLPFSYFFTGNGIKGDNLVIILNECVKKLLDFGLLPSAVVCDQGSQNRRMFSLLGGTISNPSVTINGQKLILIYDMPHLIKSLRNNLLDGNIQIDNNIISFQDVKAAYEIDTQSKTARALCKITPSHLTPNAFQKMSCKLAIQLLSRSVAATIKTCISTGELKSNTALYTSQFIEKINDMFDSANSKNLYDTNPNRRPMSERNPQVLQNLKNVFTLFEKAVKINLKNNKQSIPPCFTGLKWTITALLDLYESEKIEMSQNLPNKEYFLMTNRLTQDPLENLFSIIRQKNGYNKNPTARNFRCCFGTICSYSLMKCAESCNCEEDEDNFLNVETSVNVQTEIPSTGEIQHSNNQIQLIHDCDLESDSSSNYVPITPIDNPKTLECCATVYFTGYLAFKCLKNFSCDNCEKNLTTCNNLNDQTQLLLTFKMFNVNGSPNQGLKVPSKILIDIANICLNIFNEQFMKIKHEKQIIFNLMEISKNEINKNVLNLDASQCKEHYLYIIELLFRTKIFKACNFINAELHNKAAQQIAKLRVLQHQ